MATLPDELERAAPLLNLQPKGASAQIQIILGSRYPRVPYVYAWASTPFPSPHPSQAGSGLLIAYLQAVLNPTRLSKTVSPPLHHEQRADECPEGSWLCFPCSRAAQPNFTFSELRDMKKVLCGGWASVETCHSHPSCWGEEQRLNGPHWIMKLTHFIGLKCI